MLLIDQPPKSLNANAAFFDYNNIGPNVSDSWKNFEGSGSLVCFWAAGNSRVVASVLPASRPCSKLQPFHRLIADPDSFVQYSNFGVARSAKGSKHFLQQATVLMNRRCVTVLMGTAVQELTAQSAGLVGSVFHST